MNRNEEAAVLAAIGGFLLLLTGYNGARGIERLFTWLVDVFGPLPFLRIVAFVFVAIASLGGIAVLAGGFLFLRERVRTGRLLILIGSGAGFFTLLLFLLVNLRREEFSFLLEVLPVVVGIAFGVAARFRAKPAPIL